MTERYLSDLIREAPRPHRHRLWYFWPALVLSALFTGFGFGEYLVGHRPTGLLLMLIGAWFGGLWVVPWMREGR